MLSMYRSGSSPPTRARIASYHQKNKPSSLLEYLREFLQHRRQIGIVGHHGRNGIPSHCGHSFSGSPDREGFWVKVLVHFIPDERHGYSRSLQWPHAERRHDRLPVTV